MSDAERVAGTAADFDEAAFVALVREHGDAVFGVALRRMGDRDLAEDVAQETFLRAWRSLHGFRGESSMRAWLCTIAVNVVRDFGRARKRRVAEAAEPAHLDVPTRGEDPQEHAEAVEALERLRTALPGLAPAHREMFLLRERDGLSYREIADVLGCPIGSVMSGLARARERLLKAVQG